MVFLDLGKTQSLLFMKYLKFLIVPLIVFSFACSKDEDSPSPSPSNDNDYNKVSSCESLPQFPDELSEIAFSMIGNSCVKNDYFNNIQLGSATLVYSDGSPKCMSPTEFYKFHLGYADVNSVKNTFDVDIYLLDSIKPEINNQIDLSDSTVNAYYSYNDNGIIKSAKVISGSLKLSSTSKNADLYGEFQFTAVEFEVSTTSIDNYVLGEGNYVSAGDTIKVEGKFLAQYYGLTEDCK